MMQSNPFATQQPVADTVSTYTQNINPGAIPLMSDRILTIDDRILEAQSIFQTKFDHIQNQLNIFNQQIDEDKAFKIELDQVREEELHMLSTETDKFFVKEKAEREQQEARLT